jgi:hypothetical protein
MNKHEWEIADRIALDLFQHETDPNEVHKAFQYARVQLALHSDQLGKRFFQFLRIMVSDGKCLVRSSQTHHYYSDLETACKKNLKIYENVQGTKGKELVEIMAWVVRLMKYYMSQDFPKQNQAKDNQKTRLHDENVSFSNHKLTKEKPITIKNMEVEREKIEREKVLLASLPSSGKAKIITKGGEEVLCTGFPPYGAPDKDEMFHADLTKRGGKTLRAVYKGLLRK